MQAEFIALVLFAILGLQDLKTRKVDNILIFLLWLPAVVLSPNDLLGWFIALGLLNEVVARFCGPIVGWGDVLMFGPFMAVLGALGGIYAGFGLLMFGLCLVLGFKKKIPLGTVFFAIYLLSAAIHGIV